MIYFDFFNIKNDFIAFYLYKLSIYITISLTKVIINSYKDPNHILLEFLLLILFLQKSMWIANKSTPPMGIVQKLADLFGVTTDIMIYGDDSSDIALTDHERKHLEIYRLLDDKGQHTVDTVTQMEYERVKKDNK